MFRAVDTVLSNHEADWDMLPAFFATVEEMRTHLSAIDALSHQQDVSTVGVKAAKDQHRALAIEKAEFIGNALRAYASSTSSTSLSEQLRFSESDLRSQSIHSVIQLFVRIREQALLYSDALTDYGVGDQELEDFVQICADLPAILGSTRDAIVQHSQQTAAIHELIRETDELLRHSLDLQVKMLRSSHPDFFKLYTHARIVVDYKGKSTKPKTPGGPNDAPAVEL